jgi:outer membrane receptor for ferrienterochelin and colicins
VRRNVLCLLASVACLHAWAQQTPELNEVVVTATRIDSPLLESPSFVTVISQKDIADSGAADLSGVLAEQSGVVVNNYGPQGQTKTISMRGSSSDQVLVLLDGMRLNSSRDGSVDLSQIPTENIDHIEVVRGSASTMYGTGAIGGVINVVTKKPNAPGLSLELVNGSYVPHDATALTGTGSSFVPASPMSLLDDQKLSLSLTSRLGDVGVTGGGSLARGANAFVWDDAAVLGDWRQRNNAQSLCGDAFAGLQAPFLGGIMSARGTAAHSDVGVPGTALYPSSQADQTDTSASGSISWQTDRFFTDALTFDLKTFYRYEELTYNDPAFPPESIHHTHSASVDLTQKLSFSEEVSAVYGGSMWFDYADSTNFASAHQRLNLAGFLAVSVLPLEALTLTPSIRYDYFSDFPGSLSFQLGSVLSLSETSSLKIQLGTAYRAPTLNELYWSDPYDVGNPNLKPETSYSGEIGFSVAEKMLSVDASIFSRLVFDQINWDTSQFPATPINISEALLPGAEVHGKLNLTEQISFKADYTFIYSLLLQYLGQNHSFSDNLRVPYVPMHDVRVSAEYEDGTTTATVEMQYMGQKFSDPANTSSWALAGYVLLNAGLTRALTQTLSLSVKFLNVLNTTYYTVSGFNSTGSPVDPGYPMPPFSIETGVQLRL